jgi:hypothetical protein
MICPFDKKNKKTIWNNWMRTSRIPAVQSGAVSLEASSVGSEASADDEASVVGCKEQFMRS